MPRRGNGDSDLTPGAIGGIVFHIQQALFALQTFQVLILVLHDFVPLGPLNDIRAAEAAHSRKMLLTGMLISSALPVLGWCASTNFLAEPYPSWLVWYLLGAYGFLFTGEIEAWWATYFFGYKAAERSIEYGTMYGRTWSFLPKRHGIVPNALHVMLHAATAATLVLLVGIKLT